MLISYYDKLKDYAKKRVQWLKKSDENQTELNFTSLEKIIANEQIYQQKRLALETEKFEKAVEDRYNDFYNYSSYVSKNIQVLNEGLARFEQLQNQRLESLERDYKNHKFDQSEYVKLKKSLAANVQSRINHKQKVIQHKITMIEKTQKHKQIKLKKKIESFKQEYQEFLEYLKKDGQKRIQNLQESLTKKINANFYSNRQVIIQKNFDSAVVSFQNQQSELKKNYVEEKITLNFYESKQQKLQKQLNQTFRKFNHQASKHTWNTFLGIQKNNLGRSFGQEKIIGYSNNFVKMMNDSKLIIFFIFISLITGILFKDQYYSATNWFGAIFGSNISIGFIALGETLVILTAGIDLSVGSMIGFGGTIYMSLAHGSNVPIAGAVIVMFLAIILIGYVSGWLISRFNIPPFIITLAGLLTLRGAVTIILEGVPISAQNDPFLNFFTYNINDQFPVMIIVFIVVSALLIFFIKFSKFGRYVYAVGDNIQAARYSGINTKRILNMVYVLSAFLAGFGAITAVANVSSVSPQTGNALELDAITAVALGGTSFMGGKGGLGKTIIGWFSISLLINALTFWGVNSNWQFVVKGIVIVVALMIDRDFHVVSRVKNYYYRLLSYV